MFHLEANAFSIRAHKQHWGKTKYSYTSVPRMKCGFMLVVNGVIDFVHPLGTLRAKAGDLIYLPKYSFYEAVFRAELGSVDDYLINFDTDISFSDYTEPTRISYHESPEHIEIFKNFIDESYDAANSPFCMKGKFYLLIDSILSDKTANTKANKILDQAKKLLQSGEELSVAEIAVKCCVSESGLRKIFKDHLGMSPTEYRIREKLNRARHLLESTDMSIGEIADELNFFDTAYFCKFFRNHVGISPGKYAKNKSDHAVGTCDEGGCQNI